MMRRLLGSAVVIAVGVMTLMGSCLAAKAQSELVANWTGSVTVSSCTNSPIGTVNGVFTCGIVSGGSSTCTYDEGTSISGICTASLGGNLANDSFVSTSQTVSVGTEPPRYQT